MITRALLVVSSHIDDTTRALSNQADALIRRIEQTAIGRGKILDIEYLSVALALEDSRQYSQARAAANQARRRARDGETAAAALHLLARLAVQLENKGKQARIYAASHRYSSASAL